MSGLIGDSWAFTREGVSNSNGVSRHPANADLLKRQKTEHDAEAIATFLDCELAMVLSPFVGMLVVDWLALV